MGATNSQATDRQQSYYRSLEDQPAAKEQIAIEMTEQSATSNSQEDYSKHEPKQRSLKSTISDCIIIAIIYGVASVLEWDDSITPHEQIVPGVASDANYSYLYPMEDSTVPTPTMFTFCFSAWGLILAVNAVVLWKRDESFTLRAWLTFSYLICRVVLFSFAVTSLITDIIKKTVGAPRPYYITALTAHEAGELSERDWVNATQSFVSGHASESWSLLFLMTLYFYHSYSYAMKQYATQRSVAPYSTSNPHSYFFVHLWYKLAPMPLVSILLMFIPTFGALFVALTRMIDYKHTAADITAGALIGAVTSYVSYLIYYDELFLRFNWKDSKRGKNVDFQ